MKKVVVFLAILFFSPYSLAQANVIINEIKYSPTAKQWIEIYNDTDDDIDITKYKILDSSVTVGHKISALGSGTNLILKHRFGIIAKAPDDFSAVSFPVFKSSLNIKVSSDKVILKNESRESISFVDIDGSATDGKSLQLINGAWQVATPTPGVENKPEKKIVYMPPMPKVQSKSEPIFQKVSVEEKVVRQPARNASRSDSGGDLTTVNFAENNGTAVTSETNNHSYIFIIVFIILVGIGGGAVYFIRKKRIIENTPSVGSDFEILDE